MFGIRETEEESVHGKIKSNKEGYNRDRNETTNGQLIVKRTKVKEIKTREKFG